MKNGRGKETGRGKRRGREGEGEREGERRDHQIHRADMIVEIKYIYIYAHRCQYTTMIC